MKLRPAIIGVLSVGLLVSAGGYVLSGQVAPAERERSGVLCCLVQDDRASVQAMDENKDCWGDGENPGGGAAKVYLSEIAESLCNAVYARTAGGLAMLLHDVSRQFDADAMEELIDARVEEDLVSIVLSVQGTETEQPFIFKRSEDNRDRVQVTQNDTVVVEADIGDASAPREIALALLKSESVAQQIRDQVMNGTLEYFQKIKGYAGLFVFSVEGSTLVANGAAGSKNAGTRYEIETSFSDDGSAIAVEHRVKASAASRTADFDEDGLGAMRIAIRHDLLHEQAKQVTASLLETYDKIAYEMGVTNDDNFWSRHEMKPYEDSDTKMFVLASYTGIRHTPYEIIADVEEVTNYSSGEKEFRMGYRIRKDGGYLNMYPSSPQDRIVDAPSEWNFIQMVGNISDMITQHVEVDPPDESHPSFDAWVSFQEAEFGNASLVTDKDIRARLTQINDAAFFSWLRRTYNRYVGMHNKHVANVKSARANIDSSFAGIGTSGMKQALRKEKEWVATYAAILNNIKLVGYVTLESVGSVQNICGQFVRTGTSHDYAYEDDMADLRRYRAECIAAIIVPYAEAEGAKQFRAYAEIGAQLEKDIAQLKQLEDVLESIKACLHVVMDFLPYGKYVGAAIRVAEDCAKSEELCQKRVVHEAIRLASGAVGKGAGKAGKSMTKGIIAKLISDPKVKSAIAGRATKTLGQKIGDKALDVGIDKVLDVAAGDAKEKLASALGGGGVTDHEDACMAGLEKAGDYALQSLKK